MQQVRVALLLTASVVFVAFVASQDPVPNKDKEKEKEKGATKEKEGASPQDDGAAVVRGNHKLAAGIYARVRATTPAGRNLVVAPATAGALLATFSLGEKEAGGDQVRKGLDLTLDRPRLEAALATLAARRKDDFNRPEQFYLGMQIEQGEKGVVRVKAVTPDGPADRAGFQPGDQLLSVRTADTPGRGIEIRTAADFIHAMDEAPAVVRIRCRPAGDEETVTRRLHQTGKAGATGPARKRDPQFRAGAGIWYAEGEGPPRSVREFARDSLGAPSFPAAFTNDGPKVSEWFGKRAIPVRDVTVPEDVFGAETQTLLTDYVYVRPMWAGSVWAGRPEELSFDLGRRKAAIAAVPLTGRFPVTKTAESVTVEVPCIGGLAFLFILPPTHDLSAIDKRLATPDWAKDLGTGPLTDATVIVPEFDICRLTDLGPQLVALGMTDLFGSGTPAGKVADPKKSEPDPKKTDPKKTEKPEPDPKKSEKPEPDKPEPEKPAKKKSAPVALLQQVQVSTIAPRVGDEAPEAKPADPKATSIVLNRPFVFVVYDQRTKDVLVIGLLANPRAD